MGTGGTVRDERVDLGARLGYDENRAVVDDVRWVVGQHLVQMWDLAKDEHAILTDEIWQADVRIEDRAVKALADQAFGDLDDRAFPKVIGTGPVSYTHLTLPTIYPV